ncbi:universal stress protein [Mycolicibacterium fortuitum]|uniref:Universal stress protein n=3 Tax=Mycolicibacterium fortuitum TaxID=1766 RepID=A0A0N9Y2H5_MYCFO|nr:universal stress protein [Mycolicibacterium fortuitum]AIY45137.1 Universal stress protein family [Mycobacterium sp. VKM Ac-1817D]CRL80334.1 universal stress protein UspA-like protein [Mycolicibacter nonchromogenicus]ALI24968.1 Universal stress protein family [Mycolicibacterium fortuitum]EJZ08758.1 universal stress protein UspA-like protein [Mycolicibacterium fortuitum subsp. fortuitum DSM 46621 = ATCC 6841 = JCM 6387]MCA4721703.1 universal stress protein [Mycolicibacterium fortuitum]
MSDHDVRHGIVVGVDGSPASDNAVAWAARDAALRGVQLTLIYALPGAASPVWLDVALPQDYWDYQNETGQKVLDAAQQVAREAAGEHALRIVAKSVPGHAVATLIEYSRRADLVVVGSRGLSKWGRRLLGSVSSSLAHHAHGPVAVIPEGERPSTAPVVVGVDGSPASELATEIAFDEASRRGVELIVLHTWTDLNFEFPAIRWNDLSEEAERALSEQLAGWCERYPDVAVRRVVMPDEPARQLLAQAEAAQLVVVGNRGRGGFAGMLLGSVSSAVVHSATAPVIVARQPN